MDVGISLRKPTCLSEVAALTKVGIHVYIHIYIDTNMDTDMYTYVYVCMHILACTCIKLYKYT